MTDEKWEEIQEFTRRWAIPPGPMFADGRGVPIILGDYSEPECLEPPDGPRIQLSAADYNDLCDRGHKADAEAMRW